MKDYIIFLIIMILLIPVNSFATENKQSWEVTNISGKAFLYRNNIKTELKTGEIILEQDTIEAAADSYVDVINKHQVQNEQELITFTPHYPQKISDLRSKTSKNSIVELFNNFRNDILKGSSQEEEATGSYVDRGSNKIIFYPKGPIFGNISEVILKPGQSLKSYKIGELKYALKVINWGEETKEIIFECETKETNIQIPNISYKSLAMYEFIVDVYVNNDKVFSDSTAINFIKENKKSNLSENINRFETELSAIEKPALDFYRGIFFLENSLYSDALIEFQKYAHNFPESKMILKLIEIAISERKIK